MPTPKKPKNIIVDTKNLKPIESTDAFPAKAPKAQSKFLVIKDTREQQGWIFEQGKYCEGMITKTMKTGDYTLRGYESVLTIERKKNVAEFAGNILEERFDAELVRMENFRFAYIILEFTLDDIYRWPYGNSGLPPSVAKKIKMRKEFILKRLMDYQIQYKCKFIFAGNHGKDIVLSIFKRVSEFYKGVPPQE